MANLSILLWLSVALVDLQEASLIVSSRQLRCHDLGDFNRGEVRVYGGEAAMLYCPLLSYATVSSQGYTHDTRDLQWYIIQSDGQASLPGPSPRIKQEGEKLWLQPAMPEDSGSYVCQMRNTTFCTKAAIRLTVVQRDKEMCVTKPPGKRPVLKIPVEEYGKITCPGIEDFRHDNWSLSVQWFHNCYNLTWNGDRVIKGGAMMIYVMRENYEGNYTCVVTYKFMGRNMTYTRVVFVKPVSSSRIPKHPIIQNPDEVQVFTVQPGSIALLVCVARLPYLDVKPPKRQVWWDVDGTPVDELSDHRINSTSRVLDDALGDITMENILQIENFNHGDLSRTYTCNAENSKGKESRKAVIRLEEQPPYVELGCGLGVPVVLLVLVFIIYHMYWLEIMMIYRSWFGPSEMLDGKEYDIYISYARNSMEDEEFVLLTLQHVLENELGYKVCIFDRDSLPGGTITDETLSFISRSRRLIVVLSPFYVVRGTQALLELKAGLDNLAQAGDLRVVLVQYQPVSRSDWVRELRRARVALALIRWKGEKSADLSSRFWKQLQLELPVRRITESVNSSDCTGGKTHGKDSVTLPLYSTNTPCAHTVNPA